MSFIKNLTKGFVRSTINQVGRDGGKVISNQIYGDAHSTPYRRVEGVTELQPESQHENIVDTKREIPKSTTGKKIIYAILAYFAGGLSGMLFNVFPLLCIIPPAIFAYIGYARSHKDEYHVNLVEHISMPTYVIDRRFKDGRRYAGDVIQKRTTKTTATPEEEEEIIKRAKYWYYVSAAILIFGLAVGFYLMNNQQ